MTVLESSPVSTYYLMCSPQAFLAYVYKSKAHVDGEIDNVIITKDYWREEAKRGSLYQHFP